MYSFDWNPKTGGYVLNTQSVRFVAHEIRPVFAEELKLVGFDAHFKFDESETRPICWARQNVYIHKGEEIARLEKTQYGKPLNPVFLAKKNYGLTPVDVEAMLADERNRSLMDALVADTLKRLKEMFDEYARSCDIAYIGFSGGKDSVTLLDLCHRALPLSVPVVFSDTDMELPDTYAMWELIQKRYPDRPFHRARASVPALENWRRFGPPSQLLRWCCSVHKAAPAVLLLKELSGNPSARMVAFVGIRGEESLRRSGYNDVGVGEKNSNQINAMPILNWSAHELWLYTFAEKLPINRAYRLGLPRVGCLLCPMATDRQATMISNAYRNDARPFEKSLADSLAREFPDKAEELDFISAGGWHARQSGVSLKNVIPFPGRKKDGEAVVFSSEEVAGTRLSEWLKPLGTLIRDDETHFSVKIPSGEKLDFITNDALFCREIRVSRSNGERIAPRWEKFIRFAIQKSLACVGCGECRAECPKDAISFSPDVSIDSGKCIHCLRCFDLDEGCLRFFSIRYTGGSTMSISGINKYLTFGLDPEWIPILLAEREAFRSTQALGTRKIPSAITWFREAGLIEETTAIKLTPLSALAEQDGAESLRLWDMIWIRLVNASPLVKWYVCNTGVGEWVKAQDLNARLEPNVASASVRKGAFSSLFALVKNSPLGLRDSSVVAVETKGRQVTALMRRAHEPDELSLLYGLFVMAEAADRNVFSVTSMMTADATAPFVSPLAAFGMGPEAFKRMASGLSYNHPDFLSVRFAQGLDEVELKRGEDGKTSQDVVRLMLGD